MKLEVGLQLLSIDLVHSLVDDGDASLQRPVDAVERRVGRFEDAVGDLDRRRQRCRHHALDRRRVGRGNTAPFARPVDVSRENAGFCLKVEGRELNVCQLIERCKQNYGTSIGFNGNCLLVRLAPRTLLLNSSPF